MLLQTADAREMMERQIPQMLCNEGLEFLLSVILPHLCL